MKLDIQNLTRVFTSLRYGDAMHPMRDWLVVLSVGIVLFLLSVGWNMWLFSKVVRGELIGATSVATNEQMLSNLPAVREVVEERRREEARYKTEAFFVDPSGFGE